MCEALIKEIVIIADDTVRPIFNCPSQMTTGFLSTDQPPLMASTRFAH